MEKGLTRPPLSVLLSPHGSARGLAITYPSLAYISLVAPTPPPSPSGRSRVGVCSSSTWACRCRRGGHLSFETRGRYSRTHSLPMVSAIRAPLVWPGETEDGIVASLHSMPSPRPQLTRAGGWSGPTPVRERERERERERGIRSRHDHRCLRVIVPCLDFAGLELRRVPLPLSLSLRSPVQVRVA